MHISKSSTSKKLTFGDDDIIDKFLVLMQLQVKASIGSGQRFTSDSSNQLWISVSFLSISFSYGSYQVNYFGTTLQEVSVIT